MFIYSALVVGLLVVIGAIFPAKFGEITGVISSWVTKTFGWYYMLLYTVILGFVCFSIQSYWKIEIRQTDR